MLTRGAIGRPRDRADYPASGKHHARVSQPKRQLVHLPPAVGLALLCLVTAVSTAPNFLVTWRVARRFRRRGLAILGPPREFAVQAKYPEWITYAPGAATVLAIS